MPAQINESSLAKFFFIQAQHVCGKTLPLYKRKNTLKGQYDEALNCPDGSDELCGDPCVPDGFSGRFTIKVCRHVCAHRHPFTIQNITAISGGSRGKFVENLAKSYVGVPLPRRVAPSPMGNPGSVPGHANFLCILSFLEMQRRRFSLHSSILVL